MVAAQAAKRVGARVRRAPPRHAGTTASSAARTSLAPMQPLKGLILSGGKGTRLRPITHTSAKQLVPVANRPVLFYGIEAMADAGIEEIGIIIAPETGRRDPRGRRRRVAFGVRITYIVQDEPAGLAHAVLTAEPFLGDDPFVMYLGDNLLQGGIGELVAAFREQRAGRADPAHAGARPRALRRRRARRRARRAPGREARRAEDEPRARRRLHVHRGRSTTRRARSSPRARGELEITDAIQYLVDDGKRVEPHIVRGWWKDTGRLEDMLEANRLILDTITDRVEGELIDSSCDGRVIVEAGARAGARDRPRAGR